MPYTPFTNAHRLAVRIVLLLLLMLSVSLAVMAQDADTQRSELFAWLKDVGGIILALGGAAGIVYSVFNRKKYDNQNDIIAELQSLVKVKDTRIKTLSEEHKAEVATHKMTITQLETDAKTAKATIQALASVNLQASAILKELRIAGRWEGNEDDLFQHDDGK